jgi:hypothetical protein
VRYLQLVVGCHSQSRSQTVDYVYMGIHCLVVALVVHKALLHTLDCTIAQYNTAAEQQTNLLA